MSRYTQRAGIDLSKIDVVDMLQSLGMRNISLAGGELNFSCPFPGHAFGDSSPSAYMNATSTLWICHGCKMKGDAVSFLAEVEQVPPYKAARWLRQRYCVDDGSVVDSYVEDLRKLMAGERTEVESPRTLPESAWMGMIRIDWLAAMLATKRPAPLEYMLSRGFSPSVLAQFEVSWDPRSRRIAFPLRHRDGGLAGFKARAYEPDVVPKYRVLGDTERSIASRGKQYGFAPYNPSRVLFAADVARPNIDGEIVLVEGELNVMAMHDWCMDHAVGLGGSYVSDEHVSMLRGSGADTIVVLVDDPTPTQQFPEGDDRWLRDAVSRLEKHINVRVCARHDGDPCSMGRESTRELLAGAMTPLQWDISGIT